MTRGGSGDEGVGTHVARLGAFLAIFLFFFGDLSVDVLIKEFFKKKKSSAYVFGLEIFFD